ncbi:MAG: YfhO family protein [Lachnospiraceae bacterium]|nr:YfhO family protein [Lachnospiraceae bacterium]
MKLIRKMPYPLFAFFLSLLTFILFLFLYGVLGLGNYTILRGDLFAQYIDFISLFLKVLKGEENFWYSFSVYLGSGTALTYAYYTLSPFNLLYLADFIPIPTMTIIVIALKISLSAATFTLFSIRVLKQRNLSALFFSLCYAFNSFNITFHFNIVWLDAIFMLPLIALLTVELVKTGRFLALSLSWFYLFLTNFYMAYIVGIFVAACYICCLIIYQQQWNRQTIKHWLFLSFRFALSVILAAGMSAAILMPTAHYLISHLADDNSGFETLDTSILSIINSMMVGEMPDLDNRQPLLYCGLPVLFLFPFYFSLKQFTKKERIVTGSLLFFYFFSMLILPAYVFMHAFDYPNWYGYRFSFCVSFLLCAIALRAYPFLKQVPSGKLSCWLAVLILIYSVMISLGPVLNISWSQSNNSHEFAINLIFFSAWAILYLVQNKGILSKCRHVAPLLQVMSFILLIAELTLNGFLCMKHIGLTPLSEEEFDQWYYPVASSVNTIKENDNGLYRISVAGERNQNSPCMFGYAGLNTFSSSDDYPLRQALRSFGIATANRCIMESGYTDLTYMLLGVKYRIELDTNDGEESLNGTVPAQISLLPYNLPFAYMVSDSIRNYSPVENPFTNQETFVRCITGEEWHFYTPISLEDLQLFNYNATMDTGSEHTIFSIRSAFGETGYVTFSAKPRENKEYYACFTQNYSSADTYSAFIVGDVNGFRETPAMSYGALAKGTEFLGKERNGYLNISVFLPSDAPSYSCNDMFFAYYDDAKLPALCQSLSKHAFSLESYSRKDTTITGTVTATKDRPILFTSIPFDKGWQVWVDGNLHPVISTMDQAFLAVELLPGTHYITLQYTAPFSRIGKYISITSLIVYLILTVLSFSRKTVASNDY